MQTNFKTKLKTAITSTLAVALSVTLFAVGSVGAYASALGDARKKLAQAKAQKATAQQQLNAQYDVYYAICSEVKTAQGKVDAENNKINALQSRINALNAEIRAKKAEIKRQQALMDKKYQEFKDRLKAIYISGNTSTLEALLTCNDFSTYLTRLEMIRKVADRDSAKIEELKRLVERLQKMKAKLDADKKDLNDKKAEVVKTRDKLNAELQKLNSKKSEANSELQKCESLVASIKAKEKKYNNLINKLIQEASKVDTGGVVGTGRFCYPVPSCTTVSCGYYGYANHNGIDFSNGNVYGATVVAADEGVVASVQHLTYSYGNHIWINHGNGMLTLYAHLSATYVSPGQHVSKGQSIGAVGSTGNSTGPHLHFGCTVGGGFVNPFNYL